MWLYTDFKIYMNNRVRILLFEIILKSERLKFLTSVPSFFHPFVALTANVRPFSLLLLYRGQLKLRLQKRVDLLCVSEFLISK